MTAIALSVRKAAIRDARPILELNYAYAAEDIMVARTEFELSDNIRDFSAIQ